MESSDTDVDIQEKHDMTGYLLSMYKKERSFPPRSDKRLIRRYENLLSQFCRLNAELSKPVKWEVYLLCSENIASPIEHGVFDWFKNRSTLASDRVIARQITDTLEEIDDVNFLLERGFQLFLWKSYPFY